MPTVSGVWKWNDKLTSSYSGSTTITANAGTLYYTSGNAEGNGGVNVSDISVYKSNSSNSAIELTYFGKIGGVSPLNVVAYNGITTEGTWSNESYKTINFGDTEQEVNSEFYEWFIQNATKQEDSAVPKVSGTWVWNDTLTAPSQTINQDLTLENLQNITDITIGTSRGNTYVNFNGSDITAYSNGAWSNDSYKTFNFGSTEQEVSEEFYNYLIQNANQGGGEMPDSTKKYQIQQKQEDGMLTLHPETEASIVIYDGTDAGLVATNVQDAVDELKTLVNDITGGGVVTGVKGDSEESYRQGNVNITKANIGLGNVTNDAQIPLTQKGAASGVATLGTDSKVPVSQLPDLSATYIPVSQKGSNSGVATLGSDGKVPASQLPSYVDDVIEGYYYNGQFYSDEAHQNQITPEEGKIYIDLSTNKTYRWGGSTYAQLDSGLALGETAGTAYEGSKGKQNADNIEAIISGSQKVGSATNADNATNATHAISADSATEADHATSADSATTAGTATNAGNVTTSINGHALTEIFEENGTTVKEATHATSANSATNATNATNATKAATADKLTTARTIGLSGDVVGSASFDGSANATISATLAASGVTAGTYSVVTVDTKGRVTTGGQIIEVGTTGQSSPTTALAVGGIFFKEI